MHCGNIGCQASIRGLQNLDTFKSKFDLTELGLLTAANRDLVIFNTALNLLLLFNLLLGDGRPDQDYKLLGNIKYFQRYFGEAISLRSYFTIAARL